MEQFDSAHFICEAPVEQLCVLVPGEEAAPDGHTGAGHHVVLDQTSQRFPILQHRERAKGHVCYIWT